MKLIITHLVVLCTILIVKSADAQISTNPNNYLWRIHNQYGYLYGGPNDSLQSYIMTDLPAIYFNKPILTNSIGSSLNSFSIFTNNFPRITVSDSTGFVGIGIFNPLEMLHINGNIRGSLTGGALRINTDFGYTDIGAQNSTGSSINTNLSNHYFNKRITIDSGELSSYNEDLNLLTSGIHRLTVKQSNGNVGIGTYNPYSKLHVVGKIRSYLDTVNNNFLELGYDGFNSIINNQSFGNLIFQSGGVNTLSLNSLGKVTIGNVNNTPNGYKLFVEDGILAEKLKVAINSTADWADYVFAEDYELKTIDEVNKFVSVNNHLPNVPSASEMVSNGLDVAEMDAKLLEKIEEAYLYIIQLDERLKQIETENNLLKAQINQQSKNIENE